MNILQITNKMPIPARDGGSIASFRLSLGIVGDGHNLTLLAMNTSKHFIDQALWKPVSDQLGIKVLAVPVNTRTNPLAAAHNILFSRLPYNAVRFYTREFKRELESQLRQQAFDLIIIENLYPFLYLKTVRKWSQAPVVMRAHNIEHEIWSRTAEGSQGLTKWYLRQLSRRIRRLEYRLIDQYDLLAPITDRDLKAFEAMGNTKPAMSLPTGMITTHTTPLLDVDASHQIAHLGALDWAPNQEGILWFLKQVWPLVKAQKPTAVFHLAGRNAPAWFVKKISQPGVKYHGEVHSASDFIRHFPVHVVPLWSGSGMRIKIIEAMALGRVILTTPIGVEGISAKHRDHILIEDSAPTFAATLLEVMENPELLRQISQNAFTFVGEHYENTKLVGDFIRFAEHEINR